METYVKLRELVLSMEKDVTGAGKGNASAGRRVRVALKTVKELAKALKAETLSIGKEEIPAA